MNIKPLGNRILVKQISSEDVTKSGIILAPNSDQKEKSQYEIIAVGNGSEISSLGLQAGQVVVAGKYSGDEVDMEEDRDAKYKILYVGKDKDESDILAIIEQNFSIHCHPERSEGSLQRFLGKLGMTVLVQYSTGKY